MFYSGFHLYITGADNRYNIQSTHKTLHKHENSILHSLFPPKVVSKPDPETGDFNPFPAFPYTGPLRPVYPLSPKRKVPASIPHPDYAADGIPKSGRLINRNKVEILDKKGIEGMRKVCRLAREVLDIAAAALKPGITTDEIDRIVHEECIKRNVSIGGYIPWRGVRAKIVNTTDLVPVLPFAFELQPLSQIRLHIRQRGHLPRHPRPLRA